jgi:uncharacterized protein
VSAAFFLDTDVFVYAVRDSEQQAGAAATLEALGAGRARAVTSAAVIEELWHLELSGRIPELAGATEAVFTLLRPVLPVTDDVVAAALDVKVRGLGANDRMHVATCLLNDITTILTADQAFDAVPGLRRVDLADLPEIRALLART